MSSLDPSPTVPHASTGLRIVIPIHSFEPGGVERVALRLASEWTRCGENVTVVLGRAQGSCRKDAPDVDYWTMRSVIPTGRFETLWMILSLYHCLRRETADVLFCPGNTYTIVCFAMRLLLGSKCPTIVAKVSNDLRRADLPASIASGYRAWLRAHRAFVDLFVAPAEPVRDEIAEQVGVTAHRIRVIPNPALSRSELKRLAGIVRRPRAADATRVVAVGRLVPQKNFPLLLMAFAAQARPDDSLVIAGEGPVRPQLESLIAKLGLEGRVSLPGHCDDIPALLGDADLFALSSDYEGVPTVVIEALAAGLPVISTDCCSSIARLLGDGRFGILSPPGDVERFGQALNAARHASFPVAEARQAAAEYSLETSADAYLRLFRGPVRQSVTDATSRKQSTPSCGYEVATAPPD